MSKRVFLTLEEKCEKEKLGNLINSMKATNMEYILMDHQRAMATKDDSVSMKIFHLAKGDTAPWRNAKASEADELSDTTWSTMDSKIQQFANYAAKEVSLQYNDTFKKINDKMEVAALTLDTKNK